MIFDQTMPVLSDLGATLLRTAMLRDGRFFTIPRTPGNTCARRLEQSGYVEWVHLAVMVLPDGTRDLQHEWRVTEAGEYELIAHNIERRSYADRPTNTT